MWRSARSVKIWPFIPLARGMLHHRDMRLIALLFAGVLGTGCYATASTGYTPAYYGPSVAVSATTVGPDLVYVSPGVQVIADYNEPVFYADGFYWRETGGIWYRSHYHTHGWHSYRAPRTILGIRDRHSYRHYRPDGYTPRHRQTYRPAPSRRGYDARPAQRRSYDARPAQPQRWERRDNRQERRNDRRDNRRDDRRDRRR